MRIILLADNWVGWKVTAHLNFLEEDIIGLFVHPPEHQHYTQEIINASGLDSDQIFVGERKWSEKSLSKVKELSPDIVLVVFWKYLLPKEFFEIPPKGCINFHLSFLPYNRGKNPNVWSIIDGTPSGISMHYIDDGIDSGPILAQRKVEVDVTDTAKSLYDKLLHEFVLLFKNTWSNVKDNTIHPKSQQQLEKGTFHYGEELRELDLINLEKEYKASYLINLLRARTFSPHPSAYFIHNGRKIYVRINLEYGEEV